MIDEAKRAPEMGRENAAPASMFGDGAGARWLSWAETIAAIELTTITNTNMKALEMLTLAMAEDQIGVGERE